MTQCLLCCGFFSNVALAVDQKSENEQIVPIDREPSHRYVLNGQSIRVFDVFFPPNKVSLYHRHEADSVLVCLDGADVTSEEPGKPLVPRPPITTGLIYYRPYATQPLIHRVRNIGTTAFRILDIELLTQAGHPATLAKLPGIFSASLENNRTRVTKVVLQPNQSTGVVKFSGPRLLAFVSSGKVTIASAAQAAGGVIDTVPGHLDLREIGADEIITNVGPTVLEFVSVEVK